MTGLDDPRVEALGMLLEANNEATNAVECSLSEVTKAPLPWFGVLIRLARSPGKQLRMTELAHDMTISTSGLTRLVDRIEAAGHVERRPCTDDRRGLLCAITPEGEEILEAALPAHLASLQAIFAALDEAEITALTSLLRTVRDNVRSLTH